MEKSIQKKSMPLWLTLAAVLAPVVALAAPVLYVVTPGLGAAVMVRRNRVSSLLLLLVLPLAAVLLLYGGAFSGAAGTMDALVSGLCLVALGMLPALAIGQTQLRRQGGFVTAAAAAACCIVSLYCAVCLPGVLSGAGAFTAVEQAMAESVAIFRQLLTSIRTPETAQAVGVYLDGLDALERSVPLLLVPIICLIGCGLGLSNTLLFCALTRRDRDALGLQPIKKFSLWSIPRGATTGLFVLLAGSVVLMLTGAESAEAVNATVSVLVGFPLVVQALALIDFLLARKPRHLALKRTLVYVAVALLLPATASLFITLGCFEQLLRVRERIAAQGMRQPFPPDGGEGGGQ